MRYVPEEVEKIDKKIGEASFEDPASCAWLTIKAAGRSMTTDEIIDLYLQGSDRKRRTAKIDSLFKKAVKELESGKFIYKFGNAYYLMTDKV